jgi:hypothetical protein
MTRLCFRAGLFGELHRSCAGKAGWKDYLPRYFKVRPNDIVAIDVHAVIIAPVVATTASRHMACQTIMRDVHIVYYLRITLYKCMLVTVIWVGQLRVNVLISPLYFDSISDRLGTWVR